MATLPVPAPADAERGYPRPQLRRDPWRLLDGPWDFAADHAGAWRTPREVKWNGTILVPFAPETRASGINHTGFLPCCWYRRTLEPWDPGDGRLLLHFGAV